MKCTATHAMPPTHASQNTIDAAQISFSLHSVAPEFRSNIISASFSVAVYRIAHEIDGPMRFISRTTSLSPPAIVKSAIAVSAKKNVFIPPPHQN
jgi:hypothetical protein